MSRLRLSDRPDAGWMILKNIAHSGEEVVVGIGEDGLIVI